MGKYSRDKGKRGELDVKNRLGGSAKRTGHSFQPAADVITDFAAYSIKNKTIGGGTILSELRKLQGLEPGHNHYVVFKPARGVWVVAELLEQHVGDHGDDELRFGTKEGEAYGVAKSEGDSRGT
ncbi:hypothetical protein ACFLV0_01750 [Chloroflexota bacterium]